MGYALVTRATSNNECITRDTAIDFFISSFIPHRMPDLSVSQSVQFVDICMIVFAIAGVKEANVGLLLTTIEEYFCISASFDKPCAGDVGRSIQCEC
ncbi:hypothetical protein BCT30_22995 [Enterovibrio norvegicus]|nr:hypothetical protein A1OW_23565 [Enterovibrio norvegicus]PMI29500.1 hypothetical protein BCU47_19275 [Enterovibrio norvegicus]PMI36609.1 hypothetical protein BCU46_13645 [Enterovibrio norvegicus]PMN46034.1 hypothetical protein BCT30_22995 [Enterovibrio norvegicus]TKF16342.1 hypothetical protein FCV66_07275 [Enterovibrio norvegicus]